MVASSDRSPAMTPKIIAVIVAIALAGFALFLVATHTAVTVAVGILVCLGIIAAALASVLP